MKFYGRTGIVAPRTHDGATEVAPHVARNVEEVTRMEERDKATMSLSDHVADAVTAIAGSMLYVWLHVAWFAIWIAANLGVFGFPTFDEFPFGLLTMVVSLEAIFLSMFVLISQNRQAIQADRRARVEMQVNIMAEQEITKLLTMVAELHRHAGLEHTQDPELATMQEETQVEKLADAVEATEQRQSNNR